MSQQNAREWCDLYVKEVIHQYSPNFKIRPKSDFWLFKVLSPVIKLINPNFFTSYIITLFGTMWVTPDFFNQSAVHCLQTTAHEGRHEYDKKRLWPGVFELMYTFPQNLFVPFMALAIFWSWWFLIPALFFLLPLPAYGRYHLEMLGYACSRIWDDFIYKTPGASDEHVVYEMSSLKTYYLTWPFKSWIYKDIDRPLKLRSDPGYIMIMDFLKRHGFRN